MPVDPAPIFTPRTTPAPSGAGSSRVVTPKSKAPPVIQVQHQHGDALDPQAVEQGAQAYAARRAALRAARTHLAAPTVQQPEARPVTGPTGSQVIAKHQPIFAPRFSGLRGPMLPPTGPTHDIYSRMILKQMATMRAADPTFGQKTLAEQESAARATMQSYKPPPIGPFANEQDAAAAAQMRLKNEGLPRVILENTLQSVAPVRTGQRLAEGKMPTLGSVSSDLFNTAAFLGPDELMAPVRATKAGLSAYREAGVSGDAIRAAKATLDARKAGRTADAVKALDLKTTQSRKDYQATLKAAGYGRKEQKSIIAAHDASAVAMSHELGITPGQAWDRIYAHTQYNPIHVTANDVQTGRVVFAQEGARPEIQNVAHTPDVATQPPSPNFFTNAARRLVPAHKGALPEAYDTPTKFARLLGELRQRALDAADYKHWYANSAQGILAHVGGNTAEADKLAALVAIYSPRAEVYSKSSEWNNLDRAINAYNEFHSTGDISPRWSISSHKTGEEDWQTLRAQQVMQGNFDWQGLKTNRFYRNFLQHIDPEKYARLFGTEKFGTMDTWMRRAFKYPAKYKTETEHTLFGPQEKAVGKAQEPITPKMYSLMEKATQVVADSLGWSPEEAQAAIWTSIKAEQEGTPLGQAGFDFGDAFAHRTARETTKPTSWEQLLMQERPQVQKYTRDEAWNMEPDPNMLYHGTSPEAAASIDQGRAIHAMPTERDPSQEAVWLSEHPSRAATQGGVVYGIPRELLPQDLLGNRMAFGTYATSGDVHFGGNMARETQRVQIANEAKPGDAAIFAKERAFYDSLTPGEQASYANEVFKVSRPGTFERIVGLDSQGHHMGIGVWRGEASVGTANHVIVPELTAKEVADLNAVASAKGIIQSQDSVSWGRPLAAGKTGDNIYPGFLIRPTGNTPEAMAALGAKIDGEFGAGWVGVIHGPEGAYYLVDFSGAENFANRLRGLVHDISPRVEPISWEGGYVEDARAAQEGAWGVTYQDAISQHPQADALQKAIDDAQGKVEKIRSDFADFARDRASQRFEETLAEAAAMMGKRVPQNGRIGSRADRADVLRWLAHQARTSNDPEIHAISDVLDQAMEAANSPDPEYFFQQDNPLLRHIADEQGHPMVQAAAMQVRYAGVNPEVAAAQFGVDPKELHAYLEGGGYEKDQARILSNADVGAGEAATTEDAQTILDRAEGKTLPQDASATIKGAVARTDQGEHILHLFQGADVSTAIHELGHAVEQYLPKELRDTLGNDPEAIARTFERYFFEGGIPDAKMRPAMEKLAEGMARVYEHADAIPGAQMNPEIRRAFDNFFTREAQHTPGFTERVGASWLTQRGNVRTDEQKAADIYEPRILKYNSLEVQFPKSQARITQAGQRAWDSTSMKLEGLATRLRESSNPFAHDAGKALTPFTSRGRAPKQAAKNLIKDIARVRAGRAQAIRDIARVGKRAGFLRPSEGDQLAHFYYAQLPESHRNADGLQLIRDSLQKEYDYVTSETGAINDLHADLDSVKEQIKALGKDATMKEVGPLLQEQGAIKQEIADIPDRIYDLSRTMAKLDKVVAKPPPVNTDALAGIHQIMADRQVILEEAGVLDPQLAEERKGLLARHLGLEPDGTEAYVGHRMGMKNRGASFPRGASFGKTALPQGATSKNELALFRSGRLHQSMDSILADWNSAQGYVFHNIAKSDLANMGIPLEGRVKDGYILVNPRGQKVPRRIHMATDEATQAEGFNPDDIAEYQSNYLGETRAEQQKIIDAATEYGNLHELRQVPHDVAAKYYERLLGKRLTVGTPGLRPAGPASTIGRGMNVATNSVYMSLIYTNPGYLPGITMQNLVFAGMHQGAFLPTNLVRAGQLLAHGPQDVRDFIKGEVGIGALESIINGKDDSLAHKFIRHIHTVPDTWPRVAAFLHEAAREGIISKVGVTISDKEYAALRELFTNADKKALLRDMADRTIQSQVDFGRLGPTEQALARKILFVWPWIRGASHYPVRFALDHPLRTAIAGAYVGAGAPGLPFSLQKKNVPSWLEDSIKAGTVKIDGKTYPQVFSTRYVSPISTPYDLFQTILAKPGANTVSQLLNPLLGALWLTGNKENSFGDPAKGYLPAAESNLTALVPDYKLGQDLANPPKPGTRLYPGDSSRLGRIERALRIFPVPYDPAIALKDRERQGLSGSLQQVHEEQLVAQAKQFGLPTPTTEILASLDHKTQLDHISSTSHGDVKKRMDGAISYYEKVTGDKSFEQVQKLVNDRGTNADAETIYEAIRKAMISKDLSAYTTALDAAKKAANP